MVISQLSPLAICTVGELFGGVERHVLGMLSGLRSAGVPAQLVVFHDGELAAQARSQGDEPIVLSGRNLSLPLTARRLALQLAEQDIELVHVHGYKAAVFCANARIWHRFAIVKTEHGMPEPMVGGILATLRDRAYHALDSIAMRATNACICYVTRDLQNFRSSAHNGLRTAVVPNGVGPMNPNDFPRPPEYTRDRLNLTIVGRLDRVKGHRFVIEALAADEHLRNVDLQIVGSGPTEEELRELVERRELSGQIHFLGFRRNVYDYIAHCDALLMPSLHEGLPYTLLEAMALGRPIIASRVGGLAEVLEDRRTALLTAPGDVQALASAIRTICKDRALRESIGSNARALQHKYYSLDSTTRTYIAIFEDHLKTCRT